MSSSERQREADEDRLSSLRDEVHHDYDLHGLIGLRLINAATADVAAVDRQLGAHTRGRLDRAPDLRVRFVRRLSTPGLRYLEGGRSGCTDRDFFLLAENGRGGRAQVPFESLGEVCEIVCESGMRSVPLLLESLKLRALHNGLLPLHAAAFSHGGVGTLTLGWAHGGKTSALLAFTERGAEYIGDELLLLSADGEQVFGLASDLHLTDWQLRQLPRVRRRIGAAHLLAAKGVRAFDSVLHDVPGDAVQNLLPVRLLRSLLPRLQRRLGVELPVEVVCPVMRDRTARPERIFCLVAWDSPEIRVEAIRPREMTNRAIQLAHSEALPLLGHYHAYRFAFPGRRNYFLEDSHHIEAELLSRVLVRMEAWVVYHPRPVSLQLLYDAMYAACGAGKRAPAGVPGSW
jgi:hypothetical protein